jgi:hypothetical protein
MSVRNFERVFTRELGVSPFRYVLRGVCRSRVTDIGTDQKWTKMDWKRSPWLADSPGRHNETCFLAHVTYDSPHLSPPTVVANALQVIEGELRVS